MAVSLVAAIGLVQSKAHLVSRDQSGLTLRSLLLVLVALGLSVWGGYRLHYEFIGDADYRIHIYNSYRAQTVSIAIKRIGEKTEEVVLKEANVKPGKGISFWAIHAGEHVIDILYPVHSPTKRLSVEVPPRDHVLDVLFDLGGHGEFHVYPLFNISDDFQPEQREKELARLKKVYKKYVYGGGEKYILPVRIDYGFDQSVPIAITGSIQAPPKPAELVTPRGYVKALLKSLAGDMLEEEQTVYYVLGDKWRYRFRRRH